jgi:hypothetical protein
MRPAAISRKLGGSRPFRAGEVVMIARWLGVPAARFFTAGRAA